MKKVLIITLALITLFTITACDTKKNEGSNGNNSTQEQQNTNKKVEDNKEEKKEEEKKEESNQNNNVVIDDEIIDFDDEDEYSYEEENIVVEKIINCDGCVFAYFSEVKTIGSTLSEGEYTTDITKLKTGGGKQRHNFFGFVLSENKISKAYSCVWKDKKIYCIQGSVDGSYFSNNIGILNQLFTSEHCKYLSAGHTYWCTDGDYIGDTQTSGYTSLHYETSCTIYGADARTGQLICH